MNFWTKHESAKVPLEAWFAEAKVASWASPNDVKLRFRSADFVAGNRVIFNIAGNKYRLIVKVEYRLQIVFIRFVGTHAEYDKIDAEKI